MEENGGLLARLLRSFSKQEGLDDLLLMSEHWNGYKRENAVRRLGMLGNPVAIPKLLVRVNDWVPQVRKAAIEALRKLMTVNNAKAFTISLPGLYRLKTCSRDDHNAFVANVIEYLLKTDNVENIKEAAFGDDSEVARIAVRLCIDYSLFQKKELVEKCLSHSDVVVRSIAADLLREFSGETLDNMLLKAIKDPFMPIRREAFQIYLRKIPEKGRVIANSFLFDRHISIREIAINHLSKAGFDVKGIYSGVISTGSKSIARMRCAILGLTYLGEKEEVPSIKANLDNKAPCVRKASLQALQKLIGDEVRPLLIIGLGDTSPSVAKESSRLINKLRLKLTSDELADSIDILRHPHTLAVAMASMKKSNKWERLIFLLSILSVTTNKHASITDAVHTELGRWDVDFNRSSTQPSKAQVQRISQEYRNCVHLLSEGRKRSIEFTLGGIGVNDF